MYKLVMRGEIQSLKAGGRRYVPVVSLERFIERELAFSA
jgi:hypothetical protein